MLTLKKFDGETDTHFGIRCCEAKTDETWEEISDYINDALGTNYTSSKWRKAYQYYNIIKDELDVDSVEDQIEELNEIKEEIKKERHKLQTLNVERNRIDRQDARKELFYEQIGDCIKRVNPPQLECVHTNRNKGKKYILTIADIHDGATFISSNNEYSPKIVEDRFCILLEETIDFIKDKGLKELTVLGLGDFVNGVLRANDLRVNDSAVVQSCVHVAELMIDFLNKLSAYVEITYIDILYSNHPQIRYLGTKANAMMDEDLGYIIGHYIQTALEFNNRIKCVLPKEGDTFVKVPNIFDYVIYAGHGHQVKNTEDIVSDLSMQRHEFIDCVILGHFHSGKELTVNESYGNNVECIIAPSFIGSDSYSDSLYKGAKASCGIYGFDKENGHTETYKIILN